MLWESTSLCPSPPLQDLSKAQFPPGAPHCFLVPVSLSPDRGSPARVTCCPWGHFLQRQPPLLALARGERPSPRAEEGVSREGGPGEPAPAARGCPGRAAGLAARCPRPRRGAAAVPAAGGACGQRSGAARGGAGRAAGAAGGLPRGGGSRSGLYNAGARRAAPLRPR